MRLLIFRHALVAIGFLYLAPALAGAQRDRRLPDLLAAADAAWQAGNYDQAFTDYSEIVRRDSTSTRALFRLATLLARRTEFDAAIARFRQYCRLAPADDDGRVGLARTLAWAGRYGESIATYDSILTRTAAHRDATLGAAHALAWSGQLDSAIARYERWVRGHPADADAWTGMAQAWRWSGRPAVARQALQRALTAQPQHYEALAELRSLEASVAASIEPTVTSTNDTDRNASTTFGLRMGVPAAWNGPILVDGTLRVAALGTMRGTATTLRASTSWTALGSRFTFGGDVGATRLEARVAPGTSARTGLMPLLGARATGRLARNLSAAVGVSHASFGETAALILARIATTAVEGSADATLRRGLTLTAGGGVTKLTGGSSPNDRVAAAGSLRWRMHRAVSVAAALTSYGYRHAAADGYFAPRRYVLAEGSVRARAGGELGWAVEGEGGLGAQSITTFDTTHSTRFAQRASVMLVYRLAPGVEWGLGGAFANAASPVAVSSTNYRAWSLSLRGRLRL